MKWIFSFFIILSLFFSIITGKIENITSVILSSATDGITLFITLAGAMILWSGIMNIAKESKLTDKIAFLLSPIVKFIFNDIKNNKKAIMAISMSMCANFLGLGNAATPLGLAAMKELDNISKDDTKASKSMILFTILNTASIQLIPTTIAVLRSKYESNTPMSIIIYILPISIISLIIGISAANCFYIKEK